MDDFVVELKKNICEDPKSQKKNKSGRFRVLLRLISDSNPEFKILEFKEDGDVIFEVPMNSLNISFDAMNEYKKEFCSTLMINLMGELIIRENLSQMAQIIMDVNSEDYLTVVHGSNHRNFGMQIFRDRLVFTFHISLLQKILTEDFKRKIK